MNPEPPVTRTVLNFDFLLDLDEVYLEFLKPRLSLSILVICGPPLFIELDGLPLSQ